MHCEVPVSFIIAATGGTIEVPTLAGRVALKIPSETQSGKLFRLNSRGVKPVRGGTTGDLYCHVVIETPINLSKEQRELLKQFEASLASDNKNHSPKASSWFAGVKHFFESLKK